MLKTDSVNLMKTVKVVNAMKIFITQMFTFSLEYVNFVTSYNKN